MKEKKPENPLSDLTAPLNVNIEVTKTCNLSCIYCSASSEHDAPQEELTLDELFDLAEQLKEMKVFRIKITGGEPFYKKGVFEFLRRISMHHRITINTNCTLITKERVRALTKINLDCLIVSLDSSDAEINDNIRGKGSFKRVIYALKLLSEANIPVNILATLSRYNYKNFLGLTDIAARFGINGISLNNVDIRGRAKDIFESISLTTEEKKKISDIIKENNNKNETKISWAQAHWYDLPEKALALQKEDIKRTNFLLPCRAGVNQCGIFFNGDVVPCINFTTLVAGNIRKNSLKEIWQESDVFNSMKVLSQTKTDQIKKCTGCKYLPVCAGGCRAKAMEHNGNIYEIDPECLYHNNLPS